MWTIFMRLRTEEVQGPYEEMLARSVTTRGTNGFHYM